jgi:hypothetical protein
MPPKNHHQRLIDEGWTHHPPEDRYTKTVGDYSLTVVRSAAKGFGFTWKAFRNSAQAMSGSHLHRVGAALDAVAWAQVYTARPWTNP